MRETEGKGARKERQELAMDWREKSEEREEPDRKVRKERESPKMVRGVDLEVKIQLRSKMPTGFVLAQN
jgi:hypothetical protein